MTTASPRPASLGPLLGWRGPTVGEGRSEVFPSLVVGALLDLAREQSRPDRHRSRKSRPFRHGAPTSAAVLPRGKGLRASAAVSGVGGGGQAPPAGSAELAVPRVAVALQARIACGRGGSDARGARTWRQSCLRSGSRAGCW